MKKYIAFFLLCLLTGISSAQDWEQLNGPSGDPIYSIAINSKGDIFTGTSTVHRSTDDGKAWVNLDVNNGGRLGIGQKIIILPSDIIMVYDGSEGNLYRSANNGDTWDLLFSYSYIWNGKNGYLFTYSINFDSLSYSTDDGSNWVGITHNNSDYIYDITSDTAGIFYMCSDFVYRSLNKGKSWEKLTSALPKEKESIVKIWISPDGELFAIPQYPDTSLYRSIDQGITWRRDLRAPTVVYIMSFFGNNIIIAGSPSYISTDKGNSWQTTSSKFGNSFGYYSGLTNTLSGEFLIGDLKGQLQRLNPASSSISKIEFPGGGIRTMIENNGDIITLGTWGRGWKSSGHYTIWDSVKNQLDISAKILIKDSLGRILTISDSSILEIDGPYRHHFFDTVITSLVASPNGDLFAADINHIHRSTDNGISWQKVHTDSGMSHFYRLEVNSKGTIFTGPYFSEDNGNSWKFMTYGMNFFTITPSDDIIGFTPVGELMLSTDNGMNWIWQRIGSPPGAIYAILPLPGKSVLVATENGVVRHDSGMSVWYPANTGLTAIKINCMIHDEEGYVYAGSDVSGIFRSNEKIYYQPLSLKPWIKVSDIEFQDVVIGDTTSEKVRIVNDGTLPLILEKNFFVKDKLPFSVDTNSVVFPLVIDPKKIVYVPVFFHPPQVANYVSEIDWASNVDPALKQYMHSITTLHGVAIARSDVKDNSQRSAGISIHPNPTSSELDIEVSSKLGCEEKIEIFNELGVKVFSGSRSLNAGANKIHLDTKDLPPAMYLIRIGDASQSFVKVK